MPEFQVRFIRIPRWQIMLGVGLVFVLIAAFFLFALGVFLLLLPVLAIAAAVFYLFGGRRPPVGGESAANDRIIDGDYRVVEQDRLGHHRDQPH
jgi:hypothetical protein